MLINTISPEITPDIAYQWRLVRDFVAGEHKVKSRGEEYLPRKSGDPKEIYAAYMARAKVPDYLDIAVKSAHGMIFRRAPAVDIPDDEQLKLCIKNFNREGDSLYQFASTTAFDNMQTSFGGYLLDMPKVAAPITELEAIEKGIRPYAKYYPAEAVKDWFWRDVNGVKQLSKVILEEWVEAPDSEDNFSHEPVLQKRVLSLDKEGYYYVSIYRTFINKDTQKEEDEQISKDYVFINGEPLPYIPFFFVPYKKPEKPMFYGAAELVRHYYMQSADYENGVHMTTIPTGWSTGHKAEKDENGNMVPIHLGADSWLLFEEDEAKVGTLVFSGAGLEHCETAMNQTLNQIGVLVSKMVAEDKQMSETADAAKIHRAGENAKLATYARNLSEVFEKMVQTMADWLGIKGKVSVQFNVDFDTTTFDPNMINAIANLSREGKFPLPLVYEALKRGEIIPPKIELQDFIFLITMEANGITPDEEVQAYQKMQTGEKIELPSNMTIKEVEDEVDNNPGKNPADTKQVSENRGK